MLTSSYSYIDPRRSYLLVPLFKRELAGGVWAGAFMIGPLRLLTGPGWSFSPDSCGIADKIAVAVPGVRNAVLRQC
jgi:hypothetical protein